MRHPLIHQGEGPAKAHERITDEQTAHRRKLDRIHREAPAAGQPVVQGKRIGHRSPEGDSGRLRGIPAIGRNVAGAIPGTSPHGSRSRPDPALQSAAE